jgi:hypothetical protein
MVSHTQQNSSSRIDKTQVREMRQVGDGEREKVIAVKGSREKEGYIQKEKSDRLDME